MITVAIIGTAGRGTDGDILEAEHWEKMLDNVERRLRKLGGESQVHLISGGAAWADHLAVWAYRVRLAKALTICAPCGWDMEGVRYFDNGERDWKTNPGGTANYYHRKFYIKCRVPSLIQIHQLFQIPSGFEYISGEGFHSRNSIIAERCDYLLAYTLAEGDAPGDGGTLDTWRKCGDNVIKVHIPILSL